MIDVYKRQDIERYSIIRAVSAVERADVVIVVIDATEGVTEPVSYTHLDVNKRQGIYICAGSIEDE